MQIFFFFFLNIVFGVGSNFRQSMSGMLGAHNEAIEPGTHAADAGGGISAAMEVDQSSEGAPHPSQPSRAWHRIGEAEMQLVRNSELEEGEGGVTQAQPQMEGRSKRRRKQPDRLEPKENLREKATHPDSHFKTGSLHWYVPFLTAFGSLH